MTPQTQTMTPDLLADEIQQSLIAAVPPAMQDVFYLALHRGVRPSILLRRIKKTIAGRNPSLLDGVKAFVERWVADRAKQATVTPPF